MDALSDVQALLGHLPQLLEQELRVKHARVPRDMVAERVPHDVRCRYPGSPA